MAKWRWAYYYLLKVGELALPVYMCVGAGLWVVVAGLKTLTLLVVVLAVLHESLRHLYSNSMVNLVRRLGFFGVRGNLLVLVCVGVDLYGLVNFSFILLNIVVLKASLGYLSLFYRPPAGAQWWFRFLSFEVTWCWLTVLSVAFLSLKVFVYLVLVCVVASIIEGRPRSPFIFFSDPIEDPGSSVDGSPSLRGQLLLLMCGGVALVGLRTFTFITLGVVAIEWSLAIVAVVAIERSLAIVGVIEGTFSAYALSSNQFIINLKRLLLLCVVFFAVVQVFTSIQHIEEGGLDSVAVLAIVIVGVLSLHDYRWPHPTADDVAHALEMLQAVEKNLLFLDPYPHSERCEVWNSRVIEVYNKVEKFSADDADDEHHGCSLGLCSTCTEAQMLLRIATNLASEGKRYVAELQRLNYEHKYRRLHGMAMASLGMKVLDFLEGGSQTATSSWLQRRIWGMRRRRRREGNNMMGIWGMRGVGKTTLVRSVRDTYLHDAAASPFDHVFLLGAGIGCTVDRLRHALFVSIDGHPPPHHTSSDVVASTISSYFKGKPFLLLLDDVRERLDLAAVGLPMPLGHSQKVVFTTRFSGVCAEMGCGTGETVIQMECLGEHDAWNLFKDKVGDEINDAHPHIKHLASKMVAECHGLPSALCTLGRAMSTKRDVKEWRYAYDVLLKCKPPPHQADEIQEMDDNEGYSHLHQLEDALRDSCFF